MLSDLGLPAPVYATGEGTDDPDGANTESEPKRGQRSRSSVDPADGTCGRKRCRTS